MATWEEILAANFNPVTAAREKHQELIEKRKAENLARMQAANPGFMPGGYANPTNVQFQQFGPPSVMTNQDEWLLTQQQMASEHFGGAGDPSTPAPAAPAAASSFGGRDGRGEGAPGGSGAYSGVGPAQFGDTMMAGVHPALGFMLGPVVNPFANYAMQNNQLFAANTAAEAAELSAMQEAGISTNVNDLPESILSLDSIPGVGLPGTNTSAVGGASGGSSGGAGSAGSGTGEGQSASGAGAGPHGGGDGGSDGPDGPSGGSGTGGAPGGSAAGGI